MDLPAELPEGPSALSEPRTQSLMSPSLRLKLEAIIRADFQEDTHRPLNGAVPVAELLLEHLNSLELQPGDLARLPDTDGRSVVETVTGSQHLIVRDGDRITWERRPSEVSGVSQFDGQAQPVKELDDNWGLGKRGFLTLRDESYLVEATTVHTGVIMRIRQLEKDQ